ncbi:hypothetical protein [uncultured Litoreibacter sp.]|uniref:hypothetical protein n=1 Tax=uncultured Litoreibacter sp. TaxID=1392394 RepID=UPI0026059BE5|nr:hypothetical protein [uncultured Litoreibacter sp.]
MRFHLAIPLIFFLSSQANANQDCSHALVQDTYSKAQTDTERLAIIYSIDKANFDQFKSEFAGGGNAIIGGIPVGGDMDWNEFEEHRSRIKETYNFDYNRNSSLEIARTYLSDNAKQAYISCLKNSGKGLKVWLSQVEDTQLTISVKFDTHPGGALTDFSLGSPVGGTLIGSVPTSFPNGSIRTIEFQRDQNVRFSVVVNGDGESTNFVVPSEPRFVTGAVVSWDFEIMVDDVLQRYQGSREISPDIYKEHDPSKRKIEIHRYTTHDNQGDRWAYCRIEDNWTLTALYKDRFIPGTKTGDRKVKTSRVLEPGTGGGGICKLERLLYNR